MKDQLINHFSDKKILILGLGREGLSTYNFLRKLLPEKKLYLADKKAISDLTPEFGKISENDRNAEFNCGSGYLSGLKDYGLIVKTPGIPYKLPEIEKAKEDGVEFTSQTKIFLQNFRDKIIGVTGTKGKSTTASLINHMLLSHGVKSELIGNIGIPVLDYFERGRSVDYFVYEMSSHQLLDIDTSPHIAVFLNVFPEHLDYYKNFQEYLRAKGNITRFQSAKDVLVYNGAFDEIKNEVKASEARKIDFAMFDLPLIKTNLSGVHNLQNIKAAFLTVKEIGQTEGNAIKALKTFKPLEGRLETVGVINSVEYVSDTLATIPEAAIAAIDAFKDKKVTIILGGFDRGVSFDALGRFVSESENVINVLLIGQTSGKIKEALSKSEFKNKIYDLGKSEMDRVVKLAAEVTPKGGVVLMSPASTSFDMFKDYKDRHDQFKKAVSDLEL